MHFNKFVGNTDSGKDTADFKAVLELVSSQIPQPWTEASQREMGKCWVIFLDLMQKLL